MPSAPVARSSMLIRRPVAEVFEAFVNPDITRRFWFSHGSARLREGAQVTWRWDMYGVDAQVQVRSLEPERRILIAWPSAAEWQFEPRDTPAGQATLVYITASGFDGDADAQVAQALDMMQGFSLVLAACKAWLEHGIELNVVADHAPDAHVVAIS